MSNILSYPSGWALVIANLLPIVGVLFWNWDLRTILILYWSESTIIGFFTVLKMLFAKGNISIQTRKLFIIPFFCIHFGLFMLVHGVFILVLTSFKGSPPSLSVPNIMTIWQQMRSGFISIFLSHLISFVTNYLLKGEWKTASIDILFTQPYSRIGVMHLVVLFGGFLVFILGQNIVLLVLLVILKLISDIYAHLNERRKFADFLTSV